MNPARTFIKRVYLILVGLFQVHSLPPHHQQTRPKCACVYPCVFIKMFGTSNYVTVGLHVDLMQSMHLVPGVDLVLG